MNLIDAEILENRQVLPGHTHVHARGILSSWLIWFKCPEIAREAKPGQFIMVRCGPETTLPRPFSIHQVDGNNIALLYAVREGGRGTGWLAEQEDGQSVTVFGPLGNGFALPPTPQNLLLVAGGTGIAPLTFLADTAKSKGSMVHLHQGVNTASQLLDALPTRYVQVPYSNAPAEATLYGRPDSIPSSASTVDGGRQRWHQGPSNGLHARPRGLGGQSLRLRARAHAPLHGAQQAKAWPRRQARPDFP